MRWAIFWAIYSKIHLVALFGKVLIESDSSSINNRVTPVSVALEQPYCSALSIVQLRPDKKIPKNDEMIRKIPFA
jgi:hypothetical protein